MVVGPDFTTNVEEAQFDEVEALLKAAFPTDAEARLVRRLRADGDMLGEFQKPWEGKIGGYFALSRMQGPKGWACLAPMAVRPEWQGGKLAEDNPNMEVGGPRDELYRGSWRFGSRMLRELADQYEGAAGEPVSHLPEAIVVLGEPSFYGRYGFSQARAQNLTSPYPLSHTLILKCGVDLPEEKLVYPAAFASL
ncbi:GNAT family N-acetyltransferase [Pseudophaeobacter sp. EL27]|uniref:GNAT family N-acetyltransferase n=1 Tax=Pseudophaeobacter sp. EL27 TaxID=2107580 RepID=UPI000EFB129C|nr:N-acetyltransferase [Pseudophaeobacter sp. EL27]